MVAISGTVQPAKNRRRTAVPRRSWNVKPEILAAAHALRHEAEKPLTVPVGAPLKAALDATRPIFDRLAVIDNAFTAVSKKCLNPRDKIAALLFVPCRTVERASAGIFLTPPVVQPGVDQRAVPAVPAVPAGPKPRRTRGNGKVKPRAVRKHPTYELYRQVQPRPLFLGQL